MNWNGMEWNGLGVLRFMCVKMTVYSIDCRSLTIVFEYVGMCLCVGHDNYKAAFA